MQKLIVIGAICLLSLFGVIKAQDEAAPFLYYYSENLRTFVIERADGTDSRALSQVVIPEGTKDVRIEGWSPSGEWLAWTNLITFMDNTSTSSAWIANVDGVQWWQLPADAGNIYDISWSPAEDLLLVSDWERIAAEINRQTVYTHRFFLVDAQSQRVLTTFEMGLALADRSRATWTMDGEYVTFAYTDRTEDHAQSFVRRISRTGEIEDIPIAGMLEKNTPISDPSLNTWVLSWTGDSSQLIATDFVSEETIALDAPSPIESTYLFQWNYTGDYALLYVRTPDSELGLELWLLSIPERTLQRVVTSVGNYANETSTWFPWSFYTNHAIFYTDEGLFGLKLEPELQINQIASDRFNLFSPQWYRDGRLYFSEGTTGADGNPSTQAYTYNFLTDTLTAQDTQFSPYRISSDERFAVVEIPLSVVDSVDGEVFPIQRDSRPNDMTYFLEGVSWYPDELWFVTTETNRWVNRGTYEYMRYTSVNNVYGSVHRELSSCYSFCAAWLPEQVIAHVESR